MKAIKISTYPLKIKSFSGQKKVFDPVRMKYVVFTPEEFVRQNMIQHLITEHAISKNLMAVEYGLKMNDTVLRCDIVIFNQAGLPRVIVECKAPGIKLTQYTIDQAANYNRKLFVDYLVISNGNETYCCKMDYGHHTFMVLDHIPDHAELNDFEKE